MFLTFYVSIDNFFPGFYIFDPLPPPPPPLHLGTKERQVSNGRHFYFRYSCKFNFFFWVSLSGQNVQKAKMSINKHDYW